MINQFNTINTSISNAFAPFNNVLLNRDFVISGPISPPGTLNPVGIKTKEDEKTHRVGLKIALISAGVGLAVLAFAKGMPKSMRGKINDYFRAIENKIKNSENKTLSGAQKFYLSILKGIKANKDKVNALYNSAPLKDAFSKKMFQKVPILEKYTKWITNLFEKVTIKTSVNGYKRATKAFDRMHSFYDDIEKHSMLKNLNSEITRNGETKTVAQWAEIAKNNLNQAKNIYSSNFSKDAQLKRVGETKEDLKGLFEEIWKATWGDIKGFVKKKSTYTSFVSEVYAAQAKTKLGEKLSPLHSSVTDKIKDSLDIYKQILSPADYTKLEEETRKALKSFDKSVDLEGDKLFDKLRDLEIGAALMDSLGLVSSTAIVAGGLAISSDKNQRTSVALKYGIPAIGAVAVTLYCTLGLVSGGKALLFGTLSGFVINKIGAILDNQIKKNSNVT